MVEPHQRLGNLGTSWGYHRVCIAHHPARLPIPGSFGNSKANCHAAWRLQATMLAWARGWLADGEGGLYGSKMAYWLHTNGNENRES